MVQATSSTDISVLLANVLGDPLSVVSSDDMLSADSTSAGIGVLLTSVSGPLSTISSGSSASAVSDCGSLSFVASGGGSASAISGSGPLFFVIGISFVSAISSDTLFSLIVDDGPLSPTVGGTSLSTDSLALSLSSTQSHIRCLFSAFLVTLLAGFAILITQKRLFDKTFIKQKSFASTQE